MEKLFDGKTCQAEFLPERKMVFFSLIGLVDAEEHKAMDRSIRGFMNSTSVIALAHDLRKMSGTFNQLNDWIIDAFRPSVALGLRYHALVMGGELFRKIAAADALSKGSLIQYSIFDSREKAEIWIDNKLRQQVH